ncbi:DUF2846 domain-containing protein [Hymenobacter busanensis]|uniref:DUF2846 domain-containing protein n=1 Tax=Hymenobacter busanensis TaxID=2607656 RepID=A0A7L4ZYR9_9BACT|nr:DUF2846 domain-containing protein [Hymenobacter busanensis]KAA9333335.1 DUF2846 domain-containing protein [Hymenobacter busanensis]QHJ07986.1 DUF2846 domain-containing protein [Hymenobacter busanensis]
MRYLLCGGLLLAAAGSSFAQGTVPAPKPDMATVVFYRPAMLAQAATNFTVRANGAELCRLSNKRFFVTTLKPGETSFTSVAGGLNLPDQDKFDLNLEAGKVYYIQGDVKTRLMTVKMVFTEVTESTYKKKNADLKPDNCGAPASTSGQ